MRVFKIQNSMFVVVDDTSNFANKEIGQDFERVVFCVNLAKSYNEKFRKFLLHRSWGDGAIVDNDFYIRHPIDEETEEVFSVSIKRNIFNKVVGAEIQNLGPSKIGDIEILEEEHPFERQM